MPSGIGWPQDACLWLPATTSSVKGICKPFFGNSTLFPRSDLIYQMAHCCRAACLSFNCSPRVLYLNRCIKCIRHSYRNVKLQVHLSTAWRSLTDLSLSENSVREGICVWAPPICFQCIPCSTANVWNTFSMWSEVQSQLHCAVVVGPPYCCPCSVSIDGASCGLWGACYQSFRVTCSPSLLSS